MRGALVEPLVGSRESNKPCVVPLLLVALKSLACFLASRVLKVLGMLDTQAWKVISKEKDECSCLFPAVLSRPRLMMHR